VADFSAGAVKSSVYVQNAWSALGGRISVIAGGRFDRFSYTHDRAWSPRTSLSLALAARTKLTAAYGRYSQFPDFEQLLGAFYNPNLRAERATHYDIGLEHLVSNRIRIRTELYDRQENHIVFSPDTEWRLAGSQVLWPTFGRVLENSVTGYSRGIEFTIERRSANRVSGWLSYSYGHARYRDPLDRLSFDGDFDQRHTINAYATYRLSKTINLSGKYRYGSNFPMVGFYRGDIYTEAQNFTLTSGRNLVRVAPYNRLDMRLNKASYFKRSKITLYGEIDNLLNRWNRRYGSLSSYDFRTGQAWLNRRNMLPILPSAGFTIEF
jgi:outer membrane receptor protein involved in Fe transport